MPKYSIFVITTIFLTAGGTISSHTTTVGIVNLRNSLLSQNGGGTPRRATKVTGAASSMRGGGADEEERRDEQKSRFSFWNKFHPHRIFHSTLTRDLENNNNNDMFIDDGRDRVRVGSGGEFLNASTHHEDLTSLSPTNRFEAAPPFRANVCWNRMVSPESFVLVGRWVARTIFCMVTIRALLHQYTTIRTEILEKRFSTNGNKDNNDTNTTAERQGRMSKGGNDDDNNIFGMVVVPVLHWITKKRTTTPTTGGNYHDTGHSIISHDTNNNGSSSVLLHDDDDEIGYCDRDTETLKESTTNSTEKDICVENCTERDSNGSAPIDENDTIRRHEKKRTRDMLGNDVGMTGLSNVTTTTTEEEEELHNKKKEEEETLEKDREKDSSLFWEETHPLTPPRLMLLDQVVS